jgi:hypothetical protein
MRKKTTARKLDADQKYTLREMLRAGTDDLTLRGRFGLTAQNLRYYKDLYGIPRARAGNKLTLGQKQNAPEKPASTETIREPEPVPQALEEKETLFESPSEKPAPTTAPIPIEQYRCGACSHVFEGAVRFCPSCGVKLGMI